MKHATNPFVLLGLVEYVPREFHQEMQRTKVIADDNRVRWVSLERHLFCYWSG